MKTKHAPKDYIAVREWNIMLGGREYYWADQQHRAAEQGAPLDATYERMEAGGVRTGKWATVSGLTPDHPFRTQYARALEREKEGLE